MASGDKHESAVWTKLTSYLTGGVNSLRESASCGRRKCTGMGGAEIESTRANAVSRFLLIVALYIYLLEANRGCASQERVARSTLWSKAQALFKCAVLCLEIEEIERSIMECNWLSGNPPNKTSWASIEESAYLGAAINDLRTVSIISLQWLALGRRNRVFFQFITQIVNNVHLYGRRHALTHLVYPSAYHRFKHW